MKIWIPTPHQGLTFEVADKPIFYDTSPLSRAKGVTLSKLLHVWDSLSDRVSLDRREGVALVPNAEGNADHIHLGKVRFTVDGERIIKARITGIKLVEHVDVIRVTFDRLHDRASLDLME